MGVLPWSHHALGDLVDAPEGAPATYTNYWGYEIELLKSIAGALNFRYDDTYVNILPTKVSRYKLSNVVYTPNTQPVLARNSYSECIDELSTQYVPSMWCRGQ